MKAIIRETVPSNRVLFRCLQSYEKPKGATSAPPMRIAIMFRRVGELYFTVDLTDLESREIPIAVRYGYGRMHGEGGGEHEIMSIPAKEYLYGSITFSAESGGTRPICLATGDREGSEEVDSGAHSGTCRRSQRSRWPWLRLWRDRDRAIAGRSRRRSLLFLAPSDNESQNFLT